MENEPTENKSVVAENDNVTGNETEIPGTVVNVQLSREEDASIRLKDETNEEANATRTPESTSKAEGDRGAAEVVSLTLSANGRESNPEDKLLTIVKYESNSVSNGKTADGGEILYDRDENALHSTEGTASKHQGVENDTTVNGTEVHSSEIKLVDTEIDKMPRLDGKDNDKALTVEDKESSTDVVADTDKTVYKKDNNSNEGKVYDSQDSTVTIEKGKYDADFTRPTNNYNESGYQEPFNEVIPSVVHSTSQFQQNKGDNVLSQKVRKTVSIEDAVCEMIEAELGSANIDIPEKAFVRITRKKSSIDLSRNVLDEYLSKHVYKTAETDDSTALITIRFKIEDGKIFAGAFQSSCTVKDIKLKLAKLFEMDIEIIKLTHDYVDIADWWTLSSFCSGTPKYLDLNLSSSDSKKALTAETLSEFLPTVDVITVHYDVGEGVYKDVTVEIENHNLRKEWLGGYRNRNTEAVYHHASTQTLPKERKVFETAENGELVPILYERHTQTPFPVKNIAVDTPVDKATQMFRRDHYIPCAGDKIISPADFFTNEEWLERSCVIKKVITIQRAFKRWKKNKTLGKLFEAQRMALKMFRDEKIKILTEQAERKRKMISGAALPSSRDDFYMLYLMVGKWWKKEWQRIQDMRTDSSRKAEYVALLEKEIELLSAIEKQRIEVKRESLRKEKMRFLEITSRPTVFRNERGVMTSIDRVDTQMARTHKDTYCTLIRADLTREQRMDFLFTLRKQIVQYYEEYEFFKDLFGLIEREIDFLSIGTEDDALVGLRKRIELFYLDLIQKPKYNPKAAMYRKSKWPKTVDTLYLCIRCRKLLPVCDFPVHTRLMKILVCTSCEWLQNIGHQRLDMSPYLKLLRQVQKIEMQKCCYTSICFLLQQLGMYFLTRVVWHGHSAISETRNLAELCMVRWHNHIEWTPWNTILLTEQEAEFHASIDDVKQFYSPEFISAVRQKHILARIHFLPLLKADHALRSTGAWQNITDSGVYIHPTHIKEHFLDETCNGSI